MPNSWTINAETGGEKGEVLIGCTITQSLTQTSIFAPPPNSSTELGSVNSVDAPITFDTFSLPDSEIKFNLSIATFTYGPNSDEAHGSWNTIDPSSDPNSGDWTAQAGVGAEGEKTPASEKAAPDEKAAAADSGGN